MLPRIRISSDSRRRSKAYASEIDLVHIAAQPDVIEIADRYHRRARLDDLAKLALPREQHPRERRAQSRKVERDLRHLQIFLGALDVCRSYPDFLVRNS